MIRWVSLEVNILAICWILSRETKKRVALIYFIIQSSSSIIILTAYLAERRVSLTIITLRLLTKVGVWPIHLWFVKIIKSLQIKRESTLILITWQKIIPVIIVSNLITGERATYIMIPIIIATLLTPLTELSKKKTIKRLLALSSINNNTWMILTSIRSTKRFLRFITLYSLRVAILLKVLRKVQLKRNKRGVEFWEAATAVANTRGVPPITMFWAKVTAIKRILLSGARRVILMTLVLSATLISYHYLWATLREMIKSPLKQKKPINHNPSIVWATLTVRVVATIAWAAL